MSSPAVVVRGLKKSYGDVEALKHIDLTIAEGAVFALLGPNGAGKTTTIEILEGHRTRSAGEVEVLGFDPSGNARAFRERIGIVLQETGIDAYLTVAETIELYRGYYRDPLTVDEVIDIVELAEVRDARVRRLSGGQRRRLDVAVGLAGNPQLLFLDEPTTGFDPSARRNAWRMIDNLRSLGKTVLLTTHYMDEAQVLADEVAIIVAGEIVAAGTPSQLIEREGVSTKIHFTTRDGMPELPANLQALAAIERGRVTVASEEPMRTLHELTGWALERGIELDALTVTRPSLEDVYLRVTGTEYGEHESADE